MNSASTKTLYHLYNQDALTASVLRQFISECYYSLMIAAPKGEGNHVIDVLTSDVLEIEHHCVEHERYDLAAACRDANIELINQLDLNTTCNCCGEINCIQA